MSSSSPPPPQVPPASYAYSSGRGHGPWRNTEANAAAAVGPDAKRFRYVEPKRPATGSWDRSRDKAITTGGEDWLNPEGGVIDVDSSAADEPMISELPKFCTRCNREGHCAGEGCHALAPDAVPVTPMRPKTSIPKSRARWNTSAPKTDWTNKTEAATEAATGSASSAGGHQGALPAERDSPMPPLVPCRRESTLPTFKNAGPISDWPAPDPAPPDLPSDVESVRAAWQAVREADEDDLHLHAIEEADDADVAAVFLAAVAETRRRARPLSPRYSRGNRSCMDDPRDLEALEVERDFRARQERGETDMMPPDEDMISAMLPDDAVINASPAHYFEGAAAGCAIHRRANPLF